MPITLALADDHPIVLDGLEQLFRLEPDFQVVARCRNGEEALAALRTQRPDLLILDIRMPGLDGMAVLPVIERESLPTRVIVLTAAVDQQQVLTALRYGVRGLVLKELAPELLVEAARQVHAGGQWFDSALVGQALDGMARREEAAGKVDRLLTPREREILGMVASGLRNRAIGERLGISEGTVKLHLHHIYEKLAVDGRLELILYAQKHRLV
ncbi:MAG: response regulator transcription factor [Thermoanaerobaculia bacterium]